MPFVDVDVSGWYKRRLAGINQRYKKRQVAAQARYNPTTMLVTFPEIVHERSKIGPCWGAQIGTFWVPF